MALHGVPQVIPGTTRLSADVMLNRTGSRSYHCYFDPLDNEFQVAEALPDGLKLYSANPAFDRMVVVGFDLSDAESVQVDSTTNLKVREWRVDVTYGPFSPLLSATGNPLTQPPRYRFASSRIEKVVDKLTDGFPIINSAGDPFNPRPVKDATAAVLIVNRNEANPNFPDIFTNWVDHVNESDWNGFPARTLKICPVNLPERLYSQNTGQLYYPMEYQFEFNPDTWDLKQLNLGLREKDPNSSADPDTGEYKLRNITVNGEQISDPVPLDTDGYALKQPIGEDDITYFEGEIYDTLDFSVLGLDDLFLSNNAPPPDQGGPGGGFAPPDGGFSGGGF